MMTAAIVIQLMHLLYHQVTTWFDFHPFNGVRALPWRLRFVDAGTAFVPMVIPPLGFLLGNRTLMEIGVVCNFVILGGEIATWWVTYFFGASPRWQEMYNKIQRDTITVIPRRGPNPTINLEHMILMVLTICSTVMSFVAFHASEGKFSPHIWIAWLVAAVMTGGAIQQCSFAGRKAAPPAQ